jgi:hypothetical protein
VTVGATATEPEVAFPVTNPLPVQEVAFVEDQVSVEVPPEVMLVGDAVRDAVAAGTMVILSVFVTEPPSPVQVIL